MDKRELWERIKKHDLAEVVKRHIAIFGKPVEIRLTEYRREAA